MGRRNTKLSRWLLYIEACYKARLYFADDRTFDIAWKRLSDGYWVWWIGCEVLRLPLTWDRDLSIYSASDVKAMKKRIYRRVKRAYENFNG